LTKDGALPRHYALGWKRSEERWCEHAGKVAGSDVPGGEKWVRLPACRGFDAKPRGYHPRAMKPNCQAAGTMLVMAVGPGGQEIDHTAGGPMCERHARRLAGRFAPATGWHIEVRAAARTGGGAS
jgi:hypothetical protein